MRAKWEWPALALIVLATAVLRYPLLELPLERDEGGYAYGAQEILRGGATYVDFYTMRFPAIFGAYAAIIGAFGETARAIHLGLLLVNALTTIFIFLAGRSIFNPMVGLGAAAAYSLLNLGSATEGFSANAEQFVVLFAAPGIWLTARAVNTDRRWTWFAAGACFGMAYLMKQHGLMFVLFGGFMALAAFRRRTLREALPGLASYAAGAALPVFISLAHLAASSRLDEWRYWTLDYAGGYAASTGIAH
ncbi:MAG: glycosyltransferase family 39 protein, partial [Candidatus Hydrogenedentales bacterium]